MGGEQSRPPVKPPKVKKKRERKSKVIDYLPEVSRKRPKSGHSWRDVQLIQMLGEQGRAATFESFTSQSVINQPTIPRWQSKWEIDLRPTEPHETPQAIRTWQSMPLPSLTDVSPATINVTPVQRPSLGNISRKSKGKENGRNGRKKSDPLPDIEEVEAFERVSVSSLQVDSNKMIYRTDARANSVMDMVAKLWKYEPKKATVSWFLGNDPHLKNETQMVETLPKAPKFHKSTENIAKAKKGSRHFKKIDILKISHGKPKFIHKVEEVK